MDTSGNWQEICDTSQKEDYDECIKTYTKSTLSLRVKGDSMESELSVGDIIVINPFLKQEHDDYVFFCNEEDETTFKQLKKYGNVRVLHTLNPKYCDIELC